MVGAPRCVDGACKSIGCSILYIPKIVVTKHVVSEFIKFSNSTLFERWANPAFESTRCENDALKFECAA